MAGTAARHSAPKRTARSHRESAGAYSTRPIAPAMPSGSATATPIATNASVPAIAGATPPARPSGKPAGASVRNAIESRGAPSTRRKPRMPSGSAMPRSPQAQVSSVNAPSQPRAVADSGAMTVPIGAASVVAGYAGIVSMAMAKEPGFQPPDHHVDGDRNEDQQQASRIERVIFAGAKPGLRKLGGDQRGQRLAAFEIRGRQRRRVAGEQQNCERLADRAAEPQGDGGKQTGQRGRQHDAAQHV